MSLWFIPVILFCVPLFYCLFICTTGVCFKKYPDSMFWQFLGNKFFKGDEKK